MSAGTRLAGLLDNPLVVMDGLTRMRSWRSPLAITLYLGLLGTFGYAVYAVAVQVQPAEQRGASDIGGTVFNSLTFFQMSLVCLFAPALAAGAISGERERQTFDMLLVSRVSALGIVLGKLVTSVAYMLLLVLTALPLFAAVFLFGGIDAGQFVLSQFLTVTTAITLASISICVSAAFRRTLPATVTAYGVAFAVIVGSVIFGYLFTLMLTNGSGTEGGSFADVHPLLFSNPLYALLVILGSPGGAHLELGRMVRLLLLLPGGGGGPAIEPWQATLVVESIVVGLTTWGAVVLVRGRRPEPAPAGGEAAAPPLEEDVEA